MKKLFFLLLLLTFFLNQSFTDNSTAKKKPVIVWQPSHQTDTGKDFSEAATCNAIVEAAMKTKPKLKEYKVWSLGKKNIIMLTPAVIPKYHIPPVIVDGRISGYAYELQESNKLHPKVFIAVHNNGGTKRNAVWGYIHYGDQYEPENRELAARLIKAIAAVTDLENRGVLLDSTTGRNDYRCKTTGKLSFYSLDENINTAPYRVLLEIGDNAVSRELLISDEGRKKIGEAIKKELAAWLERKDSSKYITLATVYKFNHLIYLHGENHFISLSFLNHVICRLAYCRVFVLIFQCRFC